MLLFKHGCNKEKVGVVILLFSKIMTMYLTFKSYKPFSEDTK